MQARTQASFSPASGQNVSSHPIPSRGGLVKEWYQRVKTVGLPSPLLEPNHYSRLYNSFVLLANNRPRLWPNYGKVVIQFF